MGHVDGGKFLKRVELIKSLFLEGEPYHVPQLDTICAFLIELWRCIMLYVQVQYSVKLWSGQSVKPWTKLDDLLSFDLTLHTTLGSHPAGFLILIFEMLPSGQGREPRHVFVSAWNFPAALWSEYILRAFEHEASALKSTFRPSKPDDVSFRLSEYQD